MKAMEEVHQATTAAAFAARFFTSTGFFTSAVCFGIATSWCSVTSGVATTTRSGIATAGVTTTTNTKHTVEQFESVTMLAGAQADAQYKRADKYAPFHRTISPFTIRTASFILPAGHLANETYPAIQLTSM